MFTPSSPPLRARRGPLAAIVAIGPLTVAASMFPRALRRAHSEPTDHDASTNLRMLHRICRVYAAIGIAVPVFGFATAGILGVMGNGWVIASITLTATASAILALLILPTQHEALTTAPVPSPGGAIRSAGHLAMLTGIFNLIWVTVTVLMITRPGSTTGKNRATSNIG